MTGITLAFWRSWIAVLVYGVYLVATGRRLHRSDFLAVWQGGLAYALDIATFFTALTLTSLAVATTLSALQPVGILLFAALWQHQRVRGDEITLTAVAVCGTILVVLGGGAEGSGSVWGVIWSVAALAMWIWYFIGSKAARATVPVIEYQMWISLMAGVILLPIAAVAGPGGWGYLWPAGTKVSDLWAAVVVVAVSGTGHLLMNWAHGHTSLLVTSMITLLGPPLGAFLGLVFLDQHVGLWQWVGIGITVAALAAFLWRDSQHDQGEVIEAELAEI